KGDERLPVAAERTATEAELKAMEMWRDRALRAAGELYLAITDEQKTHLDGIEDDPVEIWKKLESVHLQKVPGACFSAWESFLLIQMGSEDTLSALMTRIVVQIKNLRPKDFSIKDLDEELVCMTMIRALPAEYQSFASSLQLLDQMSKVRLQAAFINEEQLRKSPNSTSTPSSTSVLAVTALLCSFCGLQGHSIDSCHRFGAAKTQATKDALQR
ncbi:hypothetical protein BDW22DRAFT_1318010, partial [Trametopsis cervina]